MPDSKNTDSYAAVTPLHQDSSVIGLVGMAHMISHFSQLLLAPLFPWLKTEFNVSYTELGFLMSLFFVVSCTTQTAAGFMVDRFGPRPILFAGLSILSLAAFGFASSTSYTMLAGFSMLAGLGNGVFHPVDYTLLNRKVSAPRLGHAYSVHGITGNLGWALAPAILVPLALAFSWRVALASAGTLAFIVLIILIFNRDKLILPLVPAEKTDGNKKAESSLAFLQIPAVWMCFTFFFFHAMALSVVQAFAPEATRVLHDVPLNLVALCLTVYMLCSAGGMVVGGFLASNPARCERVVGTGMGLAAITALMLGFANLAAPNVPILFGLMGFFAGIAGPSRDLLVKRSTPDNASGRVYGVVYAGLDIGQAISPLIFGALMDKRMFSSVLLGLAMLQAILVVSAFNVRKVRSTLLQAA
ncbi:Fosmidomycin resistance protein [Polaromonas vacuolata]|uniref:Fosmidomycin resistance protein n=1 Tax=Polaromonas vacuolata TaxID=37448 RepID=A0A6H2H7Z9_9BURK|nr:MFS transporter [Polaromonas vacuolata]QJC55999.1 Fosmidomycin resistance protein [Polaromonas vacuolata]